MAADQRKRRCSASIPFGYSSREYYRAKKKAVAVLHHDFNLNSHVSLKWDDNKKKVVAKGEQIGIPWRYLSQFISSVPRSNNVLADVFEVPEDIFDLKDLEDVITYEVWQSLLTETERNYLLQFLPTAVEPEQLVETLLSSNNFHFGNPFSRWAASVCSGDCHPDAVLQHEQSFRDNKKAYYSELQNYHGNMIGNLQKMKERCYSSKDPEQEIQQLALSTRRHNREFKSCDPEENAAGTSESWSWIADEKGGSSDNQNPSLAKGAELHKRICAKDFMKDKTGEASMSPDGFKLVSRPRKGEKFQKANVSRCDGARYMSYVMISKQQLDLVKSMKQSGNSIQYRALNHVLGNVDNFNVKPYEMFEEEEHKRILDHWLALANKDIPSAFANWKRRQLERLEISSAVRREMEEKLKFLVVDETKEIYHDLVHPQEDDAMAGRRTVQYNDNESDPFSRERISLSLIPSLDVNKECNPMDLSAEDDQGPDECDTSVPSSGYYHVISKTLEESPKFSNCHGTRGASDVTKAEEVPMSDQSARHAWPGISMPDSFCHSSSSNIEYGSSMSLGNPLDVNDYPPASLIDLESSVPKDDVTKQLVHRSTGIPFCSGYQNEDRNELLRSLVKRDSVQEQRKTGLEFHPVASMLTEPSQYPGNFREQLRSQFVFENKGQNDMFMNLQDRFSSNIQYSIPKQDQFSPVNIQDWSSNAHVSAPVHSHLSTGQLLNNHGWFSGENRPAAQVHGSWSGSEGSAYLDQSLGGGNCNGDQSLYSVLPQSNTFGSHTLYNTVGVLSAEKLIPTGNFREDIGGGVPRASDPMTQPASPLHLLGAHDASPTVKSSSMGWVGLPHQASALADATGKKFLKSWDQ